MAALESTSLADSSDKCLYLNQRQPRWGGDIPPDKVHCQSQRPLGHCDIWWEAQRNSCFSDLSLKLLHSVSEEAHCYPVMICEPLPRTHFRLWVQVELGISSGFFFFFSLLNTCLEHFNLTKRKSDKWMEVFSVCKKWILNDKIYYNIPYCCDVSSHWVTSCASNCTIKVNSKQKIRLCEYAKQTHDTGPFLTLPSSV